MDAVRLAAAAMGFALSGGANAAELGIVDVKASAFLEHSGRLSNDLIGGESAGKTRKSAKLDFECGE